MRRYIDRFKPFQLPIHSFALVFMVAWASLLFSGSLSCFNWRRAIEIAAPTLRNGAAVESDIDVQRLHNY
jgi:hypothetical protein